MERIFRRPLAAWLALLFVSLVIVEAGNLLLVGNDGIRAGASNALQTLAVALAAGVFVAATRRVRREKSDAASGWVLFSVGAFFFVAGAIAFYVVESSSRVTRSLNPSDVFFFLGYSTVMVGLLRLSHDPLSRGEWWNALLDLAVLSLISGVAVWEVSLRDLVSTLRTTGNAESLVALLYALFNFALLLALYFQLVVNLGRGRMFVPHLLLVCAGLCLAVSDLASGVVAVTTGGFSSGSLIDLGWLLSAAFAGFASLYVLDRGTASEVEPSHLLRATWSTSLNYTCLAGGAAVLVWGLGHRDALDLSLVAWATAGSLALVGVRQLRTVQHAVRLGDRLEASRAGLETSVRERTAELESTTAALRESEERLRHAQRVATVGSWEIDLATGTVRWSDELFRLQRRPLALGAPSYEGLPRSYTTESWEQLSGAVEQLRASGVPFELDLEVIRDDGTPWWQAARGEAVRAATGEIVGLRGTVVDITGRKRAEEVLHRSQTLLQAVTEGTPDAVFVKDTEGRYLLLNSAAIEFLGAPRDALLGKDDTVLFPPDKARQLMDADRAVMASGVTQTYEDLLTMGGVERAVLVTKGPVRDASGAVVGVFGVSRDISMRKRAEAAVRESEVRYRTLFEQAGDHTLLLELSPDGPPVIRDANEAALRAHGYTRDELVGQPIAVLEPDASPDMMEDRRRQAREHRTLQFEARHRRKDGSFFDVEVRSTEIMIHGTLHAIVTERDVTERKRSDEERARLEGELRHAQKMESVGRLAGGVAHDFNNMLGVIMGHAELAMDQVDPAQPLYDDLTEIHKAARRSGDLTRQLLAFARKQTVMPKVLDLNETVGGMLSMLGRLIGEDITLTWSPGPNLWPVKMDSSQIDQMLANLCVNSRDAIAGVGRVSIETSNHRFDDLDCAAHPGFLPGEYVRLAVSDDGCGMEQETLGQVFEPFFTTKGVGQGTGLGLSTVYGAVKQNDGFIDASSQLGGGTTFALYLPRYAGPAGSAPSAKLVKPSPRGHETILLVEDESALLRLTATMLERQGYTVLAASTPAEAIRLARDSAGQIHLLLTDMVMPEMNGRELAQAIRAFLPRIDLMFMSGYTSDVIARSGAVEDGVAFIAKPFGAREVAAKVRQVLDRTPEPASSP